MTILAIEGFDTYTGVGNAVGFGSRWSVLGNSNGSIVAGRWGGRAWQWNNPATTAVLTKLNMGAANASFGCGFAFQAETILEDWGTAGTGEPIFSLYDSADALQLDVTMDQNGLFMCRRNAATVVYTSNGAKRPQAGLWHFLEVMITISDAAGSVQMKLDGVDLGTTSSIDTKQTANANWQYFAWAISNGLDTAFIVDDLYITDGASLGEKRVEYIFPNADTADKDFTRSAGADNYALVDDAGPDSDTTYVQGSTVGDLDYYDLTNLTSTMDVIDAVDVSMFARMTDAGSREMQAKLRSNTDVVSSSNLVLTSNYQNRRKLQLTDPQGGGAWTQTRVNALQAGVEVVV